MQARKRIKKLIAKKRQGTVPCPGQYDIEPSPVFVLGIIEYLVTPFGSVVKINLNVSPSPITVYWDAPYDPNHPKR